jgi:hypothetical protein
MLEPFRIPSSSSEEQPLLLPLSGCIQCFQTSRLCSKVTIIMNIFGMRMSIFVARGTFTNLFLPQSPFTDQFF